MNFENNETDFSKGFENGVASLEKGNYEGYLSSEANYEWLMGNKESYESELSESRQKLEQSKVQRLEIIKSKQENQTIFDEQNYLITHIEAENIVFENKIEEINDIKKTNKTPYPFLAGLLYLAAGATFIAGDLIISHEIVAYALNIRNSFEAWAFAFGLAGVSVLLKPAYERLIEQPYLTNYNEKTKKIHGYFQIILFVISISTLAILGWFRYEAYKTDKLKEAINREIKTLQLETSPIISGGETLVNPILSQKIEQKLLEFNQLNQKLVNSPWALLSFVLSGVLFAVAGAICLGISFPILHVFWKRWLQLNPVKNRALRRIKRNNKKLINIKKPWFKAKTALAFEDEKLNLLPDIDQQKEHINKIIQELFNINEKLKLAKESARVSTYNEGYDAGSQNRQNMSDADFEAFRLQSLKSSQEANSEKSINRGNKLRPHLAIRNAISNSFNEN